MKTNTEKKTKSGLLSRPKPLSAAKQRQIDFIRRKANRALETKRLLALLESDVPKFFGLAEVVGKWVWIQFAGKQPAEVTRILAELGFHWNNALKRGSIRAAPVPTTGPRMIRASVMAATFPPS
jgi:hypothetical protein